MAKYAVVCGSRVVSHHRKKRAAKAAAPAGCHVRKARHGLSGLGAHRRRHGKRRRRR